VNELWQRIVAGAEQIGSVVPALAGAVVIMVTGYFLARQVQRWADDTLKRLNFDRMASAGGLDEVVDRTGLRLDPIRALAKLIFWLVMLVVILLASTALGLESINEMFGAMLAFIPTLIAGIVIVILGIIVGEFVRGIIVASAGSLSGVPTVAKLAKGAVITIALFMALQQVGVAEEIVTAAFTLILGAAALAVGLAFGLGNRELAGEITRRWYEQGQGRDRRRSDGNGHAGRPEGSLPVDGAPVSRMTTRDS
jgi:mechanosensitive ion channel-like protein